MRVQNKPHVASLRVNDTISCHDSRFSLSSACRDSFVVYRLIPILCCHHSDLDVHFSCVKNYCTVYDGIRLLSLLQCCDSDYY